jgi:hypothetical protein
MSFGKIQNRQWRKVRAAMISTLLLASMASEQYTIALAEMEPSASNNAPEAAQPAKTTAETKMEKEDQSDSDQANDDPEKQEKKRLKQLKKLEKAQKKEAKKAAKEKDEEVVNNQREKTGDIEKGAESEGSDKQTSTKRDAATEQMKDSAGKDSAVKDSAVKDSAVKDSAVKDSAVKDSAVKDSAVKDSVVKDSVVKDSVVKDSAVKNPLVKDSTVKGLGTGLGTVSKAEKPTAKNEEARDGKVLSAFRPDSALLSVLKDMTKELKEAEATRGIDDPAQRTVIDLVQEVMNKALNDAKFAPNRIVEGRGQDGSMPAMTTESWASGDVALSSSCHSSLAAVWAKRENGLLNITIAGRCLDRSTPGGKQIGEFIVIVNGRSSVEHGFDIQSQSNVHFWLGKISAVTVESDCNEVRKTEPKTSANTSQADLQATFPIDASQDFMVLPAVLTERVRKYSAMTNDLAKPNHDSSDPPTIAAQTSGFVASTTLPNGMTVQELEKDYQRVLKELSSKQAVSSKPELPSKQEPLSRQAQSDAEQTAKPTILSAFVLPSRKPEPQLSDTNSPKGSGQLQFSATDGSIHLPSMDAFLIAPERALAGQTITVIVMDGKRNGEAFVELSLNGKTAVTDLNGQHTFIVPEDTTPGHSLNVTLAARPENSPTTVEIFQPLTVSAEKQAPKIEHVVPISSHLNTIVVDGHNFDGLAGNDRANIDGQFQGRILAASPVQLRINLPVNLLAGDHTLFVTCQGMTSNSVSFHIQPTTSAQSYDSKKKPQRRAGSDPLAKRNILAL